LVQIKSCTPHNVINYCKSLHEHSISTDESAKHKYSYIIAVCEMLLDVYNTLILHLLWLLRRWYVIVARPLC